MDEGQMMTTLKAIQVLGESVLLSQALDRYSLAICLQTEMSNRPQGLVLERLLELERWLVQSSGGEKMLTMPTNETSCEEGGLRRKPGRPNRSGMDRKTYQREYMRRKRAKV
jgi:hypothetical protein